MILLLSILGLGSCSAAEISVGVASNFSPTMKRLAEEFSAESGHRVRLSSASSGKLLAQIQNGAPFDAFLSADREGPEKLVALGLAESGSLQGYAVGRLVLWSPKPGFVDKGIPPSSGFRHLSLPNPRLAPYGRAAREFLEKRALWATLQPKLVMGENIAQTLQFIASGNAELGFIALSQLRNRGPAPAGSFWQVPESEHSPLLQSAVLLKKAKERAAAMALLRFLGTAKARAIIRDSGYELPNEAAR